MDKEELFSEFHRILKEQGQEKNCFEVFDRDKTKCIFYIETTEPNQIITSIADTLNNSVNRTKINKAIEEIEDLDPITERVGLQVKQEILNILKEI